MSPSLLLYYLSIYTICSQHTAQSISQRIDEVCTTTYSPDWSTSQLHPIDSYLWNKILFKVTSASNQQMYPKIAIDSDDIHYALGYNFDTTDNSVTLRATYLSRKGGTSKSKQTQISNVSYPSHLWCAWDIYNVSTNYTHFRGGVGTEFDQFSGDYLSDYDFKPTDITMALIHDDLKVNDSKWEFYHNSCVLNTDLYIVSNVSENIIQNYNRFAINDYIHLDTLLTNANVTNIPIYITSNDIIGVDHTLHINETHPCVICSRDNKCMDCGKGIKITDLHTYNVRTNEYIITLSTLNHSNAFIDPRQYTFHRKIQNISVDLSTRTVIGGFINVSVNFTNEHIFQPFSDVHLYNDLLNINHSMHVLYNLSTDSIIDCTILDWNTLTNTACAKGIGPIIPNTRADAYMIDITSDNSYVTQTEMEIMIQTLSVDYNHWIAVTDASIAKVICPNDQCCQEIEGCFFDDSNAQYSPLKNGYLCAYNRNHSIPLCGACMQGYSEQFNSVNCAKCDSDHWQYLLFPFIIAFVTVFVLLLFDTSTLITHDNIETHNKNEKQLQIQQRGVTLMMRDETEGTLVVIFRVFVLFYQSINYILWQSGYTFWGSFVIQILSLDSYIWFWFFDYSDNGTCFLQDLKAMSYYIWYLYFPACLMLAALLCLVFQKLCCAKVSWKLCRFGGYTVWNIGLIVIFPVFVVFFIILSCVSIDGFGSVHFYAAYLQCYEISFYVALILLLLVLTFFGYIWLNLKRMDPSSDSTRIWREKSYFFKGVVRPYKPKFWYFEFVLILRRLCIIAFVTLQYFDKIVMHSILLALLLIFLIIECKCHPFKYERAFYLDIICVATVMICLLIIIINIDNDFYAKQVSMNNNALISTNTAIGNVKDLSLAQMGTNQTVTMLSMSIFAIFIPVLLLIWYIFWALWSCLMISKDPNTIATNRRMKLRHTNMNKRLTMFDDKPNSPLNGARYDIVANQEVDDPFERDGTLDRIIQNEYTEHSTTKSKANPSKSSVFSLIRNIGGKKPKPYTKITHSKSDDNYDIEMEETKENTYSNELKPPKQGMLPLSESKLTVLEETANTNNFERGRILPPLGGKKTQISERSVQSSGYDGTYTGVHAKMEENENIGDNDYISEPNPDATDGLHRIETDSTNVIEEVEIASDGSEKPVLDPSKDRNPKSNTHSDMVAPLIIADQIEPSQEYTSRRDHNISPTPSKPTPTIPINETNAITIGAAAIATAVDEDTESDEPDNINLDEILGLVLSTPDRDTKDGNASVSEIPILAPHHGTDSDECKSQPPSENNENNMSRLVPPTEGTRNVSIASDASDNKVTEGIQFGMTDLQNSNDSNNLPRQASESVFSTLEESVMNIKPAKSFGYSNASAVRLKDENNYRYDMTHHSQEQKPTNTAVFPSRSASMTLDTIHEPIDTDSNEDNSEQKRFVRSNVLKDSASKPPLISPGMNQKQFGKQHSITSMGSRQTKTKYQSTTIEESKSESESESYTYTSIDPEAEQKSWNEYEEKLEKIFFCLCTETNGESMTLDTLKRFLDIVMITEWWSIEQVLKVMLRGNAGNNVLITRNEFIAYFCDKRRNEKAAELKKHILKQIAWQLLLKVLKIFDRIDTNNSGYLDSGEFTEFGRMLGLSETETKLLMLKIDHDQSGTVTIIELFEWLKTKFDNAKQKKAAIKKKKISREWSGTATSFTEDSDDTRSDETHSCDEY